MLVLLSTILLTGCTKRIGLDVCELGINMCDDGKVYLSKDTKECMALNFVCDPHMQPFFDDNGCGCELIGKESLQLVKCVDPRPEICTEEYSPVCGIVQVQCITYPCLPVLQTFSNGCVACANPLTISYKKGACPEDNLEKPLLEENTSLVIAEQRCVAVGGSWTGYDCEGVSSEKCQYIGGTFNECASACRNSPDAQICTSQCIQVCEFK